MARTEERRDNKTECRRRKKWQKSGQQRHKLGEKQRGRDKGFVTKKGKSITDASPEWSSTLPQLLSTQIPEAGEVGQEDVTSLIGYEQTRLKGEGEAREYLGVGPLPQASKT